MSTFTDWNGPQGSNVRASDLIALTEAYNELSMGLKDKQDKLSFDTTPTQGSTNPVASNGLFNALNSKVDKADLSSGYYTKAETDTELDKKQDALTIESSIVDTNNPVSAKAVKTALGSKANASELSATNIRVTTAEGKIAILESGIAGKQDVLIFDSKPTAGSANPVTSDGVKTAISATAETAADGLSKLEAELKGEINKVDAKLTDGLTNVTFNTITGKRVNTEQLLLNSKLIRALPKAEDADGTKVFILGAFKGPTVNTAAGTLYLEYNNTDPFSTLIDFAGACSDPTNADADNTRIAMNVLSTADTDVIKGLKVYSGVCSNAVGDTALFYVGIGATDWNILSEIEFYVGGVEFIPVGDVNYIEPNGTVHITRITDVNSDLHDRVDALEANAELNRVPVGGLVGWNNWDVNGNPVGIPDNYEKSTDVDYHIVRVS